MNTVRADVLAAQNGYEVADIGLPKKDVVAAYDQAVAS